MINFHAAAVALVRPNPSMTTWRAAQSGGSRIGFSGRGMGFLGRRRHDRNVREGKSKGVTAKDANFVAQGTVAYREVTYPVLSTSTRLPASVFVDHAKRALCDRICGREAGPRLAMRGTWGALLLSSSNEKQDKSSRDRGIHGTHKFPDCPAIQTCQQNADT